MGTADGNNEPSGKTVMKVRRMIALALRGAEMFILALFVLSFAAVLVVGRDREDADFW